MFKSINKMEINTKFGVGDTAFLLEDDRCYNAKIIEVRTKFNKDDSYIRYNVTKTVPTGILSEYTETEFGIKEEDLFLSKQEVKEQIEKNKKIIEDYRKLNPIRTATEARLDTSTMGSITESHFNLNY